MLSKIKNLIFVSILLIIFSLNVNAFAVTVPPWASSSQQIQMYLGETKDIEMQLQNMMDDYDITAVANITNGSEIASLTDSSNEYLVPQGATDVKANLRISIPETASTGSNYTIDVTFQKTGGPGGEGVQLQGSVTQRFNILVAEQPAPEPISEETTQEQVPLKTVISLILILIIVIVVIFFIFKKWKK